MRDILLVFVILAAVLAFLYLLYSNGFLVYNAKTALFYRGSAPFGKGKNCIRAKFSACNGLIKRAIRLEGGKRYQFTLTQTVSKGTVSVEIQGGKGEVLLTLDSQTPTAAITAAKGARYRAVTKFARADGEYALCWGAA